MKATALIIFLILIGMVTFDAHASESGLISLCNKHEFQYFSCKAQGSGKIISVCGNVNLDGATGETDYEDTERAYLQYRFGYPNKIELIYPGSKKESFSKFYGQSIRSYFGAFQSIIFNIGNYHYEVTNISSAQNDERTEFKEFTGVYVYKGEQKSPVKIECASQAFTDKLRNRNTWGDFEFIARQLENVNGNGSN